MYIDHTQVQHADRDWAISYTFSVHNRGHEGQPVLDIGYKRYSERVHKCVRFTTLHSMYIFLLEVFVILSFALRSRNTIQH